MAASLVTAFSLNRGALSFRAEGAPAPKEPALAKGRRASHAYARWVTQIALAAGATLVAVAFAMSTCERWLAGRRRHELAWAIALVLFAAGALFLWLGASI